MKNTKFIVVEGFDGSGKTSIAQLLAKELGYSHEKTPNDLFREVREKFDSPQASTLQRIAFYLGDCIRLSVKLQTGESNLIVVDRYYYSTIAYHQAIAPDLIKHFIPLTDNLVKPDAVVLVKPDFNLACERIKSRGLNANDKLFCKEDLFIKIYENYERCIDVPVILTANSGTLDETIEEVKSKLEKL